MERDDVGFQVVGAPPPERVPQPTGWQRLGVRPGRLSAAVGRARLRRAAGWLRGQSVLDLGCNVAELVTMLPEDVDYVGMELLPEVVELAEWRFPERTFVAADVAAEWPEAVRARRFDHVVALAVLEHVARPGEVLRQAAAVLTDGGSVVVTTPHPWAQGVHRWGAWLGLFSRDADEEHERFLDGRALASLGAAAGLRVARYERFQLGLNQLVVFVRAA